MPDENLSSATGSSRRTQAGAARLAAVQTLYQMMASDCTVDDAARIYLDRFAGMDVDGEKLADPDRVLYTKIVRGVSERVADLQGLLDGHLTGPQQEEDESRRRMDPLLRAILLCGLYEILVRTDTDLAVIVSEYLHVTRAFYDGNETALVNAVLDAAGKTLRTRSE
ncbi:MAG: transcription antitermination factor NusB [Rhodospirillales bacterium]|nr:transcription antitermination factor NusB [Rhodospirillales bacterium]